MAYVRFMFIIGMMLFSVGCPETPELQKKASKELQIEEKKAYYETHEVEYRNMQEACFRKQTIPNPKKNLDCLGIARMSPLHPFARNLDREELKNQPKVTVPNTLR